MNTCSVDGCTNEAHARTWCRSHYGKAWRKGNVIERKDERMSTREYLYGVTTETGNEFITTLEVLAEMDTEKLALAFELGSEAYGALVGLDRERDYRTGPLYPHEDFISTEDDGLGAWWDEED